MKQFVVVAFYKFVQLPDYSLMKEPLITLMKENHIKGTIILAQEGINGSFCAERDALMVLIGAIQRYPELVDLSFKETYSDFNPFDKAKVKLRKEIVTMGDESVNPALGLGTHVSPTVWNALLQDPELLLIDTRNNYEVELGTFKGAINPETQNFRDFPEYVQTVLADNKDKKIAMFCTGGIRCEKSTAYLKQLGFNNVYQLEGGILNYLATIPDPESQWEGSCFVFDERVALDKNLNSLAGTIDSDWKNQSKLRFVKHQE